MARKVKLTPKERAQQRKAERIMDSLITNPYIKNGAFIPVVKMFNILNGLLIRHTV